MAYCNFVGLNFSYSDYRSMSARRFLLFKKLAQEKVAAEREALENAKDN